MRIYIAHPTDMDYVNTIYNPLKTDNFFRDYDLIFPHEKSASISNTREDYKKYDIVIAECSKPSTGVGIELGWLYDDEKPIYCFVKSGIKPSGAIAAIAKEIIEYSDEQDFVDKVKRVLTNVNLKRI